MIKNNSLKIVNIINSAEPALGGHYYTLKTISDNYNNLNQFGDTIDICIVGNVISPVLFTSHLRLEFIDFKKVGILKGFCMFYSYIKRNRFDVIHAYDIPSYSFARIASLFLGIPILLTKCGGPNFKYVPFSYNILLFSKENYEYLSKLKKFRKTKFYLSPARVDKSFESIDEKEVHRYKNELDIQNKFVIIKICRFSPEYLRYFLEILDEFQGMVNCKKNISLLLIGAIYSQEVYHKIKSVVEAINYNKYLTKLEVYLLTDDKFILNASRFLRLADVVIGTGRGAMEALSMRKPVFIGTEKKGMILVTKKTIEHLLYYNLSGRIGEIDFNIRENNGFKVMLPRLIEDKQYRRKVEEESYSIFDEYFSVEKTVPVYETIYRELVFKRFPVKPFDVMLNLYFLFKKYGRK